MNTPSAPFPVPESVTPVTVGPPVSVPLPVTTKSASSVTVCVPKVSVAALPAASAIVPPASAIPAVSTVTPFASASVETTAYSNARVVVPLPEA